jgi:sporulation protein YlmC with PRC-barrel domain
MKILVLNSSPKALSFFNKSEFSEIPWQYVKKIGTKTIIVDIDESQINKTQL